MGIEINPRINISQAINLFQFPQSYSDTLNKIWNVVLDCFNSLLSCFGLYSVPPSPFYNREFRLTKTDASIHQALEKQMRLNAAQMAREPVKAFRYCEAPASWSAHEETIGSLQVGVAHNIGRRPTMEDEHIAVSFDITIQGKIFPVQLFGIFDGHGGPKAARYVRDNLKQKLQEALIEFNPNGLTEAGVARALKIAPVRVSDDFRLRYGQVASDQGTTATIAMVLDNELWTANVGDARTVLDNNGTPVQLTEDAKPDDQRYKKEIEKRGGKVINFFGVHRVNGNLAVARAIGDYELGGVISARPKITKLPMSQIQPGSHLVLCCDGVYDVSRTVDIVGAIHANNTRSAGTLAKNIIYSAYQAGSTDNLSALVIKI